MFHCCTQRLNIPCRSQGSQLTRLAEAEERTIRLRNYWNNYNRTHRCLHRYNLGRQITESPSKRSLSHHCIGSHNKDFHLRSESKENLLEARCLCRCRVGTPLFHKDRE